MQAVVVKTTLKGEIVWKIQGPPDIEAYQARRRRHADAPYNPTNVAIAPNGDIYVGDGYGSYYINQYNSKAEYIRTFGGKGSEPGQLAEPHGIWVDTRGATPVLVVADRRNNRLQRFTLDGTAHRLRPGLPAALPLRRAERHGRHSRPARPRDADRSATTRSSSTSATRTRRDWNNPLRTQPRDKFIPGQFICPHGACFDHDGNIFVVEWVEVGRVTKLRKV